MSLVHGLEAHATERRGIPVRLCYVINGVSNTLPFLIFATGGVFRMVPTGMKAFFRLQR
jgi:hypothetical protein